VEVVQLYVRDRVGSVTRPVRELKGFLKLGLAAGAQQRVTFSLTAAELGFWGPDMIVRPEAGLFDIYVGGDSRAEASAELELFSD
jgi:beta-glucosidase